MAKVELRIVAPRRNAYGPVGIALGADCLYAWQWIDLNPAMTARLGPGVFGRLSAPDPVAAASIRIRLCRTERATLSDLIAAVERMRLDLADAPRARPAVAIGTVPLPRRNAAARRRRPAAVARVAPSPPARQDQAMRTAPLRPDATGRRYLAEPDTAPRSLPPSASADPSAAFIADPRPPGEPTRPRSAPASAGAGTASGEFRSDLPAQAYRPSRGRD